MQALSRTPNLTFRHRHAALQPALPLLVRGHAPAHGDQGLLFRGGAAAPAGGTSVTSPYGKWSINCVTGWANAMMSTPLREPSSWTTPSFPPKYPLKRGTNR